MANLVAACRFCNEGRRTTKSDKYRRYVVWRGRIGAAFYNLRIRRRVAMKLEMGDDRFAVLRKGVTTVGPATGVMEAMVHQLEIHRMRSKQVDEPGDRWAMLHAATIRGKEATKP